MEDFFSLVKNLKLLPGVGEKSAMRFASFILNNKEKAKNISTSIATFVDNVDKCSNCNNISHKNQLCEICSDYKRENTICVLQTATDLLLFEKSGIYKGKYFVLEQLINPINGIFEEELRLDKLKNIIEKNEIKEIIISLGFTPEAEITTEFIKDYLKNTDVKISKPAQGIPIGADIEYIDNLTLQMAFKDRKYL